MTRESLRERTTEREKTTAELVRETSGGSYA